MKKAILAATALLIGLEPAFALAQEHGGREEEHRGAPAAAPRNGAPTRPGPMGGPVQESRGAPAGAYRGSVGPQGPSGSAPAPPYRGYAGAAPAYRGYAGGAPAYRGYAGGAPAYRGYAGGAPAGEWRGAPGLAAAAPGGGARPFTYNGRPFFRYRAQPYYYPAGYEGWTGHRWRAGEWLPAVFISSAFFIADYYDFGLWDPGYGLQWIRVGADAVLVNLADGQVVDVVPGVYYY